ncbi:hypothetical protein HPP92_013166 [Vanilla planifolia]|uniref:Uncharacterized protein n=1 Tax=Vanilla planifolia TaxID=51239 RepID=A0A835UY82_VANPL|nr:hypothetical protein HPP92_013166 [Vanilla planifolia]
MAQGLPIVTPMNLHKVATMSQQMLGQLNYCGLMKLYFGNGQISFFAPRQKVIMASKGKSNIKDSIITQDKKVNLHSITDIFALSNKEINRVVLSLKKIPPKADHRGINLSKLGKRTLEPSPIGQCAPDLVLFSKFSGIEVSSSTSFRFVMKSSIP